MSAVGAGMMGAMGGGHADVEMALSGIFHAMFFPNGTTTPSHAAMAGLQMMLERSGYTIGYDHGNNLHMEKKVMSVEEQANVVEVPSLVINPTYVYPRPYTFVLYEKVLGAGHDAFNIYNASGETVMTARGKHFGFGKTITISDMRGQKLVKVVEKMLHLHKTYHFENSKGKTLASAQKHIVALKSTFSITDNATGKNIYKITGNWKHYNFDVSNKKKQVIARIRERDSLNTVADKNLNTYEIYCEPRVDTLMILALAIMCDCVDND